MPKHLLAPARLQLLLPWLNEIYDEHVWGPNPLYGQPGYGDGEGPEDFDTKTNFAAIRQLLEAFVASFDGSVEAAHVIAEPNDTAASLDDEAIGDLEVRVRFLLNQGFGDPSLQDSDMASMPIGSLRLMVRGAGRQKPGKRGSIIAGGVAALRDYRAPGAYVLRVIGPMRDLVPFLVAALLTGPNMASVKRCERIGCGHFVIASTGKKGPPQRFCSEPPGVCRTWSRQLPKPPRKPRRTT